MFAPYQKNASPLEDLLDRSSNIIPMTLRYHHPNFSHTLPSELLLSLLPPTVLLQLRLASRRTAMAVSQALPSAFKIIYMTARHADQTIATERSLRALQRVGHHCQDLVIRLHHLPSRAPTQPAILDNSNSPPQPHPKHHRSASSSAASPSAIQKPFHKFHWPKHTPFRDRSGSGSMHHMLRSPPPPGPTSAPRLSPALTRPFPPPTSIPQFSSPTSTQAAPPFKRILAHLPNLSTLEISMPPTTTTPHSNANWATGLGSIEAQLIALRIALEESSLPELSTLRLRPIHAMGILHLRWAGGGSWREASWMAGRMWMRVRDLDITMMGSSAVGGGISGGKGMTKDQGRMFVKVLHDYLGSFRLRLEVLRFWWGENVNDDADAAFERGDGGDGGGGFPNPILLDLDDGGRRGRKGFSAPAIEWKVLRECWLGNVRVDALAVELIWQRARRLRVLRVMDEFWDGGLQVGNVVLVEGVWWRQFWGEEVLGEVGGENLVEDRVDEELGVGDSAGVSDDERVWEEGSEAVNEWNEEYDDDEDVLSQTSMVVPFMLQR